MSTDLSPKSINCLGPFAKYDREKIYFGFLQNYQSPHTRLAYGKDIKEFLRFLGDHFPHLSEFQVEHPHIVAFRDYLVARRGQRKQRLGKRSINRKLATLGAFYRYLYWQGYVQRIPTDRLQRYKIEKAVVTNDLSDQEVRALLAGRMPENWIRKAPSSHAPPIFFHWNATFRVNWFEIFQSPLSTGPMLRRIPGQGRGSDENSPHGNLPERSRALLGLVPRAKLLFSST